jgi:hypothetical protein
MAIAWEIWRKGRRLIWIPPACLAFCAFLNLVLVERFHLMPRGEALTNIFGWLMALSLLVLMGIFNYTEHSATKEWHGFPYRLFALPVQTWKLVGVPMLLGCVSLQLIYWGWIKLVWTEPHPNMPAWFAAVLGGFLIFYQATLWGMAAFRIARIALLGIGGAVAVGIACIPLGVTDIKTGWQMERPGIAVMAAVCVLAYFVTWALVSRQRSGGGRRRNWFKAMQEGIVDLLPRRRRDFGSPAAAQFWYDWRRVGWVLPVCLLLVLLLVVPISWASRDNAKFTVDALFILLMMPMVLAFVIGKGFSSPEFWSPTTGYSSFLKTRPLPAGEFIISRMKVAALAVVVAWLFEFTFLVLWLGGWADWTDLDRLWREFQLVYPWSWSAITGFYILGFMVLSWRGLIGGLWLGMSGNRRLQTMVTALQVVVPVFLLIAWGISADAMDRAFKEHPAEMNGLILRGIAWLLALAVIGKFWLAAFSWSGIFPRRTRQYLAIWAVATAAFILLAVLSRPLLDTYRLEMLYLLGALLVFPLARLGLAPSAVRRNRHQ